MVISEGLQRWSLGHERTSGTLDGHTDDDDDRT